MTTQGTNIPLDQALQMAFAKVGQLTFQIDVMAQQLQAFEQENKRLKAEIEGGKKKGK